MLNFKFAFLIIKKIVWLFDLNATLLIQLATKILLRKLLIILILMLNINNININNEKYTYKYIFNCINDFDININNIY